jgi:acyl carrier protein
VEHARARQAIADHLGVGIDRVVDQAAFRDLGADSLDLIELTMFLEHEFDVEIPDEEAFRCANVGDAMKILAAALAVSAPALPLTEAQA